MLLRGCGGEALAGGPADGGVAAGVVEEHAAAGFAAEDGVGELGVGVAVGEVVPALGADHHLAGGALVVEGFGEGGALGLGDAVVGGEEGLAGVGLGDEGAEGLAFGFDGSDGGGVLGEKGGGAGALGGEGGGGVGEGGGGAGASDFEDFGGFHGGELVVFEFGDGLAGEGDFVLEGGDLGGGSGSLHLLLEAGDLAVTVFDVELLRAAEGFFPGERPGGFGEGDFSFGARGLGGGDADGGIGELGAEAAEFEVHGLEGDEVFEVGVHEAECRGACRA